MNPYFDRDGVTIYCGDAIAILPTLGLDPASTVVVTDPPYNIGTPALITDMRTPDGPNGRRLVGKDFGAAFDTAAIGPEAWFSLMPNTVLSFYDARNIDRLICAARAAGFETVQDFHWCKTNPPVPMRSVGFAWGVESGYVFRRIGTKHIHNDAAGISPNWFQAGICGGHERLAHPTQKPRKVMKWLVDHFTLPGMTVLDPFCGVGSTLEAARDLGRKCCGIELNPEYARLAMSRFQQRVLFTVPPPETPA